MVLIIVLSVIAAWLGLALVVAALCAAAARGDRALHAAVLAGQSSTRRFRAATTV